MKLRVFFLICFLVFVISEGRKCKKKQLPGEEGVNPKDKKCNKYKSLCTSNAHCCTYFCVGLKPYNPSKPFDRGIGECRLESEFPPPKPTLRPGLTTPRAPPIPRCRDTMASCTISEECCSRLCIFLSEDYKKRCYFTNRCRADKEPCTVNDNCCSNTCIYLNKEHGNRCVTKSTGCRAVLDPCVTSSDCCSKLCITLGGSSGHGKKCYFHGRSGDNITEISESGDNEISESGDNITEISESQ